MRCLVEEQPTGKCSVPGRQPAAWVRQLEAIDGRDGAEPSALDQVEEPSAGSGELEVVNDSQDARRALGCLCEQSRVARGNCEWLFAEAVQLTLQSGGDDAPRARAAGFRP